MRIVRSEDVAPTPWKNGGGRTRELLRVAPPGPAEGQWLLRISLAEIESDGPFSAFEGVAREFAVLSGHGVELRWPGPDSPAPLRLTPASPALAFDGGRPPECMRIDGPTRDLNVMTLRAQASAAMQRAEFGRPLAWPGDARGVFACRPILIERAGVRIAVPAFALAWAQTGDAAAWTLHPDDDVERDAECPAACDAPPGAPPAYWIGLRLHGAPAP